mmetsp:Transcript_5303/g.11692  ORF Transcript_5303/g.11692 Transcript_5303/m.11692 type:complete len:232 (-) Transcript_5303:144-839(-)
MASDAKGLLVGLEGGFVIAYVVLHQTDAGQGLGHGQTLPPEGRHLHLAGGHVGLESVFVLAELFVDVCDVDEGDDGVGMVGREHSSFDLESFLVVVHGGGEVLHFVANISQLVQCGGDVGAVDVAVVAAAVAVDDVGVELLLQFESPGKVVERHFEIRFLLVYFRDSLEDQRHVPGSGIYRHRTGRGYSEKLFVVVQRLVQAAHLVAGLSDVVHGSGHVDRVAPENLAAYP